MSTGLLVGIDLLFTVLLLLAVLYALRGGGVSRRRTRSASPAASAPSPPSQGAKKAVVDALRTATPDEVPQGKAPDAGRARRGLKRTLPPAGRAAEGNGETGRFLGEAVELHRQGLSPEQIARRLNASTGEVQMVLTFHGMESGKAESLRPQALPGRLAGTERNVA